MTLQDKINYSINLIQKCEKLALQYSPDGFHIAFSGGKDSQVIYELAKMAGVKFKSYFYKTSIDPKELLVFIKENYPEVVLIKPQKTMFQLILEKKIFPTRRIRYCCEYLKERKGINSVVIVGIRKEESARRKKREELTFQCIKGNDKYMLHPILEWTKNDVFSFLENRNIKLCSLYKTQKRIGCVGCPMVGKNKHLKQILSHKNFYKAYCNTAQKLLSFGDWGKFDSGEEIIEWWTSGISKKQFIHNKENQTKLKF